MKYLQIFTMIQLNKVWSEYKISIKISIKNNLECKVTVEDQDNHKPKYKMEQRSDGFQQFISILLNLSGVFIILYQLDKIIDTEL